MTYGKEILATIISDHAKGATAEEIQRHLMEIYSVRPCTNTIYEHCKAITVEQVVDELQRQQERDITKETDSDIRMFYRDRLLEKLMPLKQIIISKNINENKTEINVTSDLLKQYENLFEEAALLEHCTPQQIHTPPTNRETSLSVNG